MNKMQVVIMAGGRGTRIAELDSEVPKPMIRILHKPVLEYQINVLKSQGFTEIIIVIGYLGHIIREYFQDGRNFGVNIQYIEENSPLGTAGALYYLKENRIDDILLLNGDVIFDINISRFYSYHKEKRGIATLVSHPNSHPYDSGILLADKDCKVIKWIQKEEDRGWYKNRVNAGIHLLSKEILDNFTELKKRDLDRDILKPLIEIGKLYLYDSPEYVKDMGTPERFHCVTEDIRLGRMEARNLCNMQKAIFLDRDGTINVYKGFLKDIREFELLDGAAEAIKMINESGYLAIVVSNQPVIARGELSLQELEQIHNKMETLLGEHGAYLDAIYFCPHHPDKGFEGEQIEYKVICNCRKPNPGMLWKAKEDYNISFKQSWMVGDSPTDIEVGKVVGCNTAAIGMKYDYTPSFANLRQCIEYILNKER